MEKINCTPQWCLCEKACFLADSLKEQLNTDDADDADKSGLKSRFKKGRNTGDLVLSVHEDMFFYLSKDIILLGL
ncbi:hypothetical protein KAR48_14670 [bacterium]|nr:hypothetical protein [bacterium]